MWRSFPIATPFGPANTRKWSIDQLQNIIEEINVNPNSRRLIVSSWHPGLLPDASITPNLNAAKGKQALPPCHTLFQFITIPMTAKERGQIYNADMPVFEDGIDLETETDEEINECCDCVGIPKNYLSCQLYQRSADLFLGVPFNITSYSILTYLVAHLTNTVPYEFIHTIGDAHIYNNHHAQVKTLLKRKSKKAPTFSISERAYSYTSIDQFTFEDIIINDYEHHAAIAAPVSV
jgi:thymidylate synthase